MGSVLISGIISLPGVKCLSLTYTVSICIKFTFSFSPTQSFVQELEVDTLEGSGVLWRQRTMVFLVS